MGFVGGAATLSVKLVIGVTIPIFIAIINYLPLRYFPAISAKNDDHHHRPTAIAFSLGLFLLLIAAYAGLYEIEMPQCFADGQIGPASMVHQAIGAIYFSAITITTLGYGDIQPAGDFARMTAAAEALNGLAAFGVFTGAVTGYMAAKAVETPPAQTDR
ncbi:MAG: two pore domain potassium channel family protein [Alphaproteobacteria bacterium]|nr:two pore domain potassium channel family protein [Alphaproteobacteria bacterium]